METIDEDGETPMTAAALAGKEAIVGLLLKNGAAIMGRNEGGFTALHAAAYKGFDLIVEVLLANGAEINDLQNKAMITPLHAATERRHATTAKYLIERGAHVDIKELNGWTPLVRATFKQYHELVLLLRSHGAKCPTPFEVGPNSSGYCLNPGK